MTGLKSMKSDFLVAETVMRLIKRIEKDGWHIFALIDHSKQARDKGLELRPTQVILFGNPQVGTLLMQDHQTVAIDLPVKALVWEDGKGHVQIAYNTMEWIKERHFLRDGTTMARISEFIESACLYAAKG